MLKALWNCESSASYITVKDHGVISISAVFFAHRSMQNIKEADDNIVGLVKVIFL